MCTAASCLMCCVASDGSTVCPITPSISPDRLNRIMQVGLKMYRAIVAHGTDKHSLLTTFETIAFISDKTLK